jgi:hypothetical protein
VLGTPVEGEASSDEADPLLGPEVGEALPIGGVIDLLTTESREEGALTPGPPLVPRESPEEDPEAADLAATSPASRDLLDLPLPAAPSATTLPAGLTTLQDVRLGIASEGEDAQLAALHRTWERAYARSQRLEERGWDTVQVEGRLMAARSMELRGEPRLALYLVEEALVLAKAMSDVGEPPPSGVELSAGGGRARPGGVTVEDVERLLERERELSRALWGRETEGLRILVEEELEGLRAHDLAGLRYEGRRERERELEATEAWLEAAFEAADARRQAELDARSVELAHTRSAELEVLREEVLARLLAVGERTREERGKAIDLRLAAFLKEERFQVAASDATAARPQKLLDRPETLGRIDAVASRLDSLALERAEVREAIDLGARQMLERFIRGGNLVRGLEPLLEGVVDQASEQARESLEPQVASLEQALRARLAELESRLGAAGLGSDEVAALARREVEAVREPLAQAAREEAQARVEAMVRSEAFDAKVSGVAAEAAARAVTAPKLLGRVEKHVLESKHLAPRVLKDEAFSQRMHQELAELLRSRPLAMRVKGLIEEGLPTSAALRQALSEGIEDDEGAGGVVDERIDDRIKDKSASLLDQRVLRRKITNAVREEMVEEVFLKNVDARVAELADEGSLALRIKALIAEEIKGAIDSALSNTETLRRLVTKELANREAIKTAALTGDGLSDPSTAIVRSDAMAKLLDEKIREAMQGTRRRRGPRVGLEAPDVIEEPQKKPRPGRVKDTRKKKKKKKP